MSEELKPCPFCGQMPKVAREYHEKWTRDSESGKMILHVLPEFDDWVGCDNKECFIHYNQIEEPPVERLENWNTRPIEDALQARIAELEALAERLIEAGEKLHAIIADINYEKHAYPCLEWHALTNEWRESER